MDYLIRALRERSSENSRSNFCFSCVNSTISSYIDLRIRCGSHEHQYCTGEGKGGEILEGKVEDILICDCIRIQTNLKNWFFWRGGDVGWWLPVDEILIRILFLLKYIFESSNIVLRKVKEIHCKYSMINKCYDLDYSDLCH